MIWSYGIHCLEDPSYSLLSWTDCIISAQFSISWGYYVYIYIYVYIDTHTGTTTIAEQKPWNKNNETKTCHLKTKHNKDQICNQLIPYFCQNSLYRREPAWSAGSAHMVFPGCVSSFPRWASARILRTSFLASERQLLDFRPKKTQRNSNYSRTIHKKNTKKRQTIEDLRSNDAPAA